MSCKSKNEHGNILASSLLVMLAMNLLAITLVQTSLREFKTADLKISDSTTFYLAETCIDNSISWFKGFNAPPAAGIMPYTITKTDISNLYDGTETQQMLNKLSKYSYNCTASALTTKSTEGKKTGVGEDISQKDTYGLSGDLRPTYYYQIESIGQGPQNSKKKLITIVSVEY